MALYVYGIMRAHDGVAAAAAAAARGLDAVEHDGISALVGETPEGEPRLRRENIMAHADVVQDAFSHGPVLPFRFGTAVADAQTVVAEVLAPQAQRLASRLAALKNKVEMQVKATYAEEPVLRSILAQDPALARVAQRVRGLPEAATHFERIRIGEAIAGALQTRRAADGQALLNGLARFSLAHVVSPPNHERSVLNGAFLVEREGLNRFDHAVEDLSEQHSGEIEFKLIGPLPAYSFSDQDWDQPIGAEVGRAWA